MMRADLPSLQQHLRHAPQADAVRQRDRAVSGARGGRFDPWIVPEMGAE